jgi:hypothetical protein
LGSSSPARATTVQAQMQNVANVTARAVRINIWRPAFRL